VDTTIAPLTVESQIDEVDLPSYAPSCG